MLIMRSNLQFSRSSYQQEDQQFALWQPGITLAHCTSNMKIAYCSSVYIQYYIAGQMETILFSLPSLNSNSHTLLFLCILLLKFAVFQFTCLHNYEFMVKNAYYKDNKIISTATNFPPPPLFNLFIVTSVFFLSCTVSFALNHQCEQTVISSIHLTT